MAFQREVSPPMDLENVSKGLFRVSVGSLGIFGSLKVFPPPQKKISRYTQDEVYFHPNIF